ncbi:NAD(+) diphosphatase [Chitinolyticbacter meiyuanensis]|uniref:NAD(+) diphosphatase n=1 Tax=Chitinolyticbacter meiyuanensis TaxID=682798 RepID=UPI0011E5B49D|nr:NAD(+) diphosphatase [Chitinolyticbacter meiyuanensis]
MLPGDFISGYRQLDAALPNALTLAFDGDALLLAGDQPAQLAQLPAPAALYLIGEYRGWAVQLALLPRDAELAPGLTATPLRAAWGVLDEALWLIAGRAIQLATFHRTHAHCGVCGSATVAVVDEAACACPACGHRVWPRVSPAVMVLIQRGNGALLLARSPHFRPGMYSALAGFVEPGESLEACAHREVLEEVGVTITNLRWFGSQSWPFPHSLMLAFVADYMAGDIVPQPGEIEDARWFNRDAMPVLPGAGSIAYRLIRSVLDAG